jgi:hypothetical protein
MSVWSRNWKINVGFLGLEDAEFMLEKCHGDPATYYTMKLGRCNDEETWADCSFIRRGFAHLEWNPQKKLPPYDPADPNVAKLYKEGIEKFLKRVSSTTRRLEGEVAAVTAKTGTTSPVTDVVVTPTAVTLLVALNAVKCGGDRDLLIVVYRATLFGGGVGPAPDGTGHGDPT